MKIGRNKLEEMHLYVLPLLSLRFSSYLIFRMISQHTARKVQSSTLHTLHAHQLTSQARALTQQSTAASALHSHNAHILDTHKAQVQRKEAELRRIWGINEKDLWTRIDTGIKWEEDRVRKEKEEELMRWLEEEKVKAEQERTRREEEEKRRAEEERKRLEEERQRQDKQRVEESERKEQEMAIAKKEAEKAEEDELGSLGMTTAEEDWRHARLTLKARQCPLIFSLI